MFLNIIWIILITILILYLLYYKKDEVYYIEDFLTKEEYNYIKNYTRSIKNLKSEKFRLIKPILDKKINDIFYSEKYINKIKNYVKSDIKKSNFPIEFRFISILICFKIFVYIFNSVFIFISKFQ